MSQARWRVEEGDGATVAEILARMGEGAKGAAIEGRAFVAGKRVADADAIQPGDELEVHGRRDLDAVAAVRILAQHGGLVIADKPAGLATAPERRGDRSLVQDVAKLLGIASSRVHPASRLDVGVSGAVTCCLDDEATRLVERARAAGAYTRTYVAIAAALVEGEGRWDAPIGWVRRGERLVPVANGHEAKAATTRFVTLAVARGATLLQLEPVTGRMHQLRVHAADAGAPIFGDREHGGPRKTTDTKGRVIALDRVALHAIAVRIADGAGGEIAATSPSPPALRALWSALEGDDRAWESVDVRGSAPSSLVPG